MAEKVVVPVMLEPLASNHALLRRRHCQLRSYACPIATNPRAPVLVDPLIARRYGIVDNEAVATWKRSPVPDANPETIAAVLP